MKGPAALPAPPLADATTVRRLSVDVARRLDGLLQGDNLGLLLGPGGDPADARRYVTGDDVRRMDWAATARTTQAHVRTTIAERELVTTLLVDLSRSMSFGTAVAEKRDVAIAVAASFVHLTRGPGNRLGALVFSDEAAVALPTRSGEQRALVLSSLLRVPRDSTVSAQPAGTRKSTGGGLASALTNHAQQSRRPGLTVVISDLLEPVAHWAQPLRAVAARHDVMVVEVSDRRERALPPVGILHVVDPDTGDHIDLRTTKKTRERYAQAAAARLEQNRLAVRSAGAGHVLLRTEEDWLPQLVAYPHQRRRTRLAPRAGAR